MFILDDMLLRQLGISLPGLDLLWTIEQIRDFAYKELYNPEKIKNQIKENRMLYEFGEISLDEYNDINASLMQQFKLTERSQEMNLSIRRDILGAR
ncbi:MAG: hypothetical protein SCH66_03010 [Methanolobus sp.]|nr:hypothetical protein [Methanolobus sp.]